MVLISKVVNSGLLFLPQNVFQDVGTPQQSSIEQYNIVKYLGGSGPYIQRQGNGISTDFPQNCKIEQINMISRHGERFPSKNDGIFFKKIMKIFNDYNEIFKGDLKFLNNYKYFVENLEYYEKETNPNNSKSIYTGTTNLFRHGNYFRSRYDSLFNKNDKLVIFTSNSGRCYQSGEYFARGFLGNDYNEDNVEYVIIDEATKLANTLTPRYFCKSFNQSLHLDLINQYDKTYLQDILSRLTKKNPNLKLTTSHIQGLFLWVAFEINVKGYSPFAKLFTLDEYIKNGYRNDLVNYYGTGPGNNITTIIGSPMVEAFLKLLQNNNNNDDDDKKIILTFTHDTDIEVYLSSMGLIVPSSNDLPIDHIPFPNPYNSAELFPQAARIYIEKLKCEQQEEDNNDSNHYIRFIVNDSVYPYPGCNSGPGFSCEMNQFINLVKSRLNGINYKEQCQIEGSSELTFYWDYTTNKYNAPLIDQ